MTSLRVLRQVLLAGDLGEVEHALCALAAPPAASLDALSARLDAADQRSAITGLQVARWNGGDVAAARAALREAFIDGPRWRVDESPPAHADQGLPPLYPEVKRE